MSMQASWGAKCLTLLGGTTAACASPGVARSDEPLVEVMIMATIHMGNPGRDIHNMTVPDVLLLRYQAQILQVTARRSYRALLDVRHNGTKSVQIVST